MSAEAGETPATKSEEGKASAEDDAGVRENEKGAVVAEVSGEAQNQKADSGEGAEESESNNGEGAGDASKEEDEAKVEDESSEFLSEWVRKSCICQR